jgi:hypothetical protein
LPVSERAGPAVLPGREAQKRPKNRPSDRISKQKNGTCSQNIYGNIIDLSRFAPAARRPIDAIALDSIG